jgi:hypothetical protein
VLAAVARLAGRLGNRLAGDEGVDQRLTATGIRATG